MKTIRGVRRILQELEAQKQTIERALRRTDPSTNAGWDLYYLRRLRDSTSDNIEGWRAVLHTLEAGE